jgi:hypothetical protein
MKRLILIIFALLVLCSPLHAATSHIDMPTPFDITMLAGSDFSLSLKSTNELGTTIDLTGYQFRAQFRSAPAPAGVVFANYSISIMNAPSGLFQVTLSRFKTLSLSGKSGVWDLLQTDPSGKVVYLISGKAAVKPTATRLP